MIFLDSIWLGLGFTLGGVLGLAIFAFAIVVLLYIYEEFRGWRG